MFQDSTTLVLCLSFEQMELYKKLYCCLESGLSDLTDRIKTEKGSRFVSSFHRLLSTGTNDCSVWMELFANLVVLHHWQVEFCDDVHIVKPAAGRLTLDDMEVDFSKAKKVKEFAPN